MFTGIINNSGRFKGYRLSKQEMSLEAPTLPDSLSIGASLAVNGVCLSLVKRERETLSFNLSPETLEKTTLGSFRPGDRLNLELPLTLSTPLSGHLVTGHIDGIEKITRVSSRKQGKRLSISLSSNLKSYFIPKGSVAVDGVSLTIATLSPSSFDVEIIPITLKNTNLEALKPGTRVNIECDIIGKYVYNWLHRERQEK